MVDMMYLQLMGVVKCHRPTLVDHVVACRSLLIRGFELSWASPLLDAFAFKVWRMSKPTHVRWTQKECKRLLGAVVMCRENGKSKSTKPSKKNNHRKKSHRKKILQIEIPTAQLLNFSWLFPENELPMATPKNRMSEWKILRFPSYQQKQPRLHRHPHHGLLQRTWNDWGWTPSLATVLCHFSDLIHGMQIPSGND